MPETPKHGEIRKSTISRRQWKWCSIWNCWQWNNYEAKIYGCEKTGFTCSIIGVWQDKQYETFKAAEISMFGIPKKRKKK